MPRHPRLVRFSVFKHAFTGKYAWVLAYTCRHMQRLGSRNKWQQALVLGRGGGAVTFVTYFCSLEGVEG